MTQTNLMFFGLDIAELIRTDLVQLLQRNYSRLFLMGLGHHLIQKQFV